MTPAALLLSLALDNAPIDSIDLAPVVVEAQAVTVSMRGDTLVFTVASFLQHKGERLKSLLQNLPGVEVTADGTIKAKGRAVDRLLINGKNLTGLKESVLLDNLRAEALVSIRLYDTANERDRETGIVQAGEEQVMDLVTHEDKKQGWLYDMTAGKGSEERYSANASASRFSEVWQNMFTITADNLPGVFGVGESYYDKLQKQIPSADSHRRNVNGLVSWEDGAWKVNACAYYDGSNSTDGNHNLFESILPGMASVQESHDTSRSRTNTLSIQMGIEWHDSLTSLHIDPYINWTHGQGTYRHESRTTDGAWTMINRQMAENVNRSTNLSAEFSVRVNHKLRGKKGRNIDLSMGINTELMDETATDDNTIYYFMSRGTNMHSLRLSDGETGRSGMRLRVAYVEPLLQCLKLQGEYTLSYREDKADHPVYLIECEQPIVSGPTVIQRNDSLSRNAGNREVAQRGRVVLQFMRGNTRLSLGSVVESGHARTKYERHSLRLDTLHSNLDWSPELHLTWRDSHGWSVTAGYDGRTQRPSIIDRIPVDDTSNPLNIRCGNPGLKNAFIHTMNVSLFYFSAQSERQFNLQLGGDIEHRALTQTVSYNPRTGVRRYSTINVDGNRRMDGAWGFQSAFGRGHCWYLDLQGSLTHQRKVGLQDIDGGEAYRYVTRQQQCTQYAALQFKERDWSVKPYLYGSYERLRSDLVGSLQRDLYTYGYGGVARYEFAFGLSLAVDAYTHCRRGYAEPGMNINETIIDAELCYTFLSGRNAEVSLQVNDLLGQRDMVQNYTYISGRSEYRYERAVNSYAMVSFTYRF